MRRLIHLGAVLGYIAALYLLAPVAQIGAISGLAAMLYGAVAAVAVYAVAVFTIGLLTGTPISKWPQIARQFFRAARNHDSP